MSSPPDDRPSWTPPTPVEMAAEFPKLTVESLLARGGMSAVYLVRQNDLDRLAVLKILPLDVSSDGEAVSRFRTEARALASVRDRGVVEVYDFGSSPGGHLYLLLEYEEGGDLRRWMRERSGVVSPAEALAVGAAVAGGLAAAHRRGIIHGDIKPDNIFLDSGGQLKLGDFGLAAFGGETEVTHHTPGYTAPEILAGHRQPTPQSDLYAVGATLFELLLKQTPPDEPGSRAVQLQKLPAPVTEVLGWALQDDPAARPASAEEYRTALEEAGRRLQQPASGAAPMSPLHRKPRILNRTALPPAGSKSRNAASPPWLIIGGAGAAAAAAALFFLNTPPADTSPADTASLPAGAGMAPSSGSPQSPAPSDSGFSIPQAASGVPATPPMPGPASAALSVPPGAGPGSPAEERSVSPGTAAILPDSAAAAPAGGSPVMADSGKPAPDPEDAGIPFLDPDSSGATGGGDDEEWLEEGKENSSKDEIARRLPGWKITARDQGADKLYLREEKELGGHSVVVPAVSRTEPGILSQEITLPADIPMELSVRVAPYKRDDSDFILLARLDGTPLTPQQVLSNGEAGRVFRTLTWDLSRWKGKTVSLSVENHNGGDHAWHWEYACYDYARIQPLSPVLAHARYNPAEASTATPEAGFVDLFNKQQAPGWSTLGDGGLAFDQGTVTPFTRPGPQRETLSWFTKKVFSDFILRTEFKLLDAQTNSGIMLRFPDPSKGSPETVKQSGMVQLELRGYQTGPYGTGTFDGQKLPDSLPLKPDTWNLLELAVQGRKHTLRINGRTVNEFTGGSSLSGYIGIQGTTEGAGVQYRNFQIRELPPDRTGTLASTSGGGPKARPLRVPPDAVPFNGRWYRFYPDKMLWRMARKRCEDLRGRLVVIPDKETSDFLATLANGKNYWAGASDEKQEGTWRWVDDSALTFNQWAQGEPNDLSKEDFLLVCGSGWEDRGNDSSSTQGFICEWQ